MYRNSEIIQHILIFARSQVGENILDEIFYWVLIICVRIYFVFSWKTDGLTSLLQEESCPYRSKWECFIDNSPHGNWFNAL